MRCYLCESDKDVKYCKLCKHWLCKKCKKNYKGRIFAMIKEKLKK